MICSRRRLLFIPMYGCILFALSAGYNHAQTAAPVLVAKITGSVNTKTAKAGDAIEAKLVRPLKLEDGTSLPNASKLIGKVVAVQSKQEGRGTSMLAIKFDQVEVKGGAPFPIDGQIVAIGPDPAFGPDTSDTAVLSHGGPTSSSGLSPRSETIAHGDEGKADIPRGSTLRDVHLDFDPDAAGASELHGAKKDIKLDSQVLIKVRLN
jgi:hypothetical protein